MNKSAECFPDGVAAGAESLDQIVLTRNLGPDGPGSVHDLLAQLRSDLDGERNVADSWV